MVERNLIFQNPTSEAKLDLLIDYCGIADGQRVLDVGCGRAWLLRRMAATRAIEGVGVEKRAVFKKEADAAHALQRSAGAPGSFTVHCMPAAEFDARPASFDVALCVGAASAIGT
ncbi:MAG: SAM-dependent methyltransferase, partial [Gammaproteobacteria bacterium]|nr:SAM-dependent methyltransferase [Gammaproteobacteria bacterium]